MGSMEGGQHMERPSVRVKPMENLHGKTLKTLNPLLLGRKEEKRNNSLEGVEFPRWLDQSPFSASPLTL